MLRSFTDHPASVGETYLEHLVFACVFGGRMLAGGAACCIHGVLPFLFPSTGSRTVLSLHAVLLRKRSGTLFHTGGRSDSEYAIGSGSVAAFREAADWVERRALRRGRQSAHAK